MDKVADLVTGEQILTWLIIAALFLYFVYKEWPEFKRRISKKAVKDTTEALNDRTVLERLDSIEADQKAIKEDIKEINAKLMKDYERINRMDTQQKQYEKLLEESLEERSILMGAMLGVLGGLQELGANGPTQEAEKEIRDYLNKQAHRKTSVAPSESRI